MNDDPPLALGDIATTWRKVNDPLRFVMAYGAAARAYLVALLRDCDAADEVLQQLLLQVTEKGFPALDPAKGKFRHYLKTVLRNAASRHRKPARLPIEKTDPDTVGGADTADEKAWREQWRTCVLEAAWRSLDRHQRKAGRGNLAFTVLRLTADHPEIGSEKLAALVAEKSGQPLSPEAFRKQLSRARRTFAELIVAEVRQSLDGGTDDEVIEELAELGLLGHVRDFLPSG